MVASPSWSLAFFLASLKDLLSCLASISISASRTVTCLVRSSMVLASWPRSSS
uniref:Uncharacterized protein n=1 Tax=Stenotrophomonas maltophilia TaxID=40324 RepID=A0A0A0R2T8_STEMA|nr:hypothetical protein [Stenotrophomonas maltophilia]